VTQIRSSSDRSARTAGHSPTQHGTSQTKDSAATRRLARGGALNFAGTLVGAVAGIGLVVLVTNTVTRELAGMLFAATSLFLVLGAIAMLGSDAGLAHAIQRHLVAGRPDHARATIGIALRAVVALSTVVAIVIWVCAPWAAPLVADADPGAATGMLRVLAAALPVATAYDTLLIATLAYGTARPNVLIEKLGRLPGQVLLVLAVILLDTAFGGVGWFPHLGPVGLAIAWSAPYLFGLVAVSMWCRRIALRAGRRPTGTDGTGQQRDRSVEPASTGPQGAERARLARDFWAFSLPRALGKVCQVALQRLDIVLVAALLSPAHAAVYTAATRFLVLGQLATQAMQQVLAPQLSGMFAREDLPGIRRIFATSTAWLMSVTWPVYLASAATAPLWLRVFGKEYASGHVTVLILAATMLVVSAIGSVDVVLLMAGRSRQSLVNNALALAVNIATLLLLVPRLGVTGAALAWSAALLVRNVLPMVQVHRSFGVVTHGAGVVWVAVSASLCFGVLPLALAAALSLSLSVVAASLVVAAVGYAWMLWSHREVLDLSAFKDAVPRLKWVRSTPRQTVAAD